MTDYTARVQRTMIVNECDALLPSLLRCLRDCGLSALPVEEGGSALSYAETAPTRF